MEYNHKMGLIQQVQNKEDKIKKEPDLRALWRHCFADTMEYENFYFQNVYEQNVVYMLEEKGMLHLNPYLCSVQGKKCLLHYIVGVGTHMDYRRQGIMARMLREALQDMYEKEEAFTYLMPADVAYYEPFGFVSVSGRKRRVCKNDKQIKIEQMRFLSYSQLKKQYNEQQRKIIFQEINGWLQEQYTVFAIHDMAYFELLYQEKNCQGGDVVFCFQENCLLGYFAYAVSQDTLIVEQFGMPERETELRNRRLEQWLLQFSKQPCEVMESFPYMVRVVCIEAFLKLFAECFREFTKKAIRIVDPLIAINNGVYYFVEQQGTITLEKRQCDTVFATMTVEELVEFVFNSKDNKLFFAEIV